MNKHIVAIDDLGAGIKYNPETKKVESNVLFGTRTATVDLMINGIQLVFREILNSDGKICPTGVRVNGAWYGDSPNDEPVNSPWEEENAEPSGAVESDSGSGVVGD